MPNADRWWLRPVRMMRRDYIGRFEQFMASDLEALARESKERWHVNLEWVMATPGCAPGLAYQALFNSDKFEKFPALGDFDMLREYLPHARRYGIRLVPYVNLHWYSYDWAAQRPGWEQVLQDGTPYGRKRPLYGGGTTMCVNSQWRDWSFELIREVMRTGVDGCFLDGPVVYPGACYCPTCRGLFARQTGQDRMPAWADWTDPLWKRFTRFRAQSWADYMRDAQSAAREINPDAVIFLNGGHAHPSALNTARDPYLLEPFQTFNGSEEFFHCGTGYDSPYKSLNLARFLSAGSNPAVVFTHHTLSTWHYNPLPKAEMVLAMASAVAGGANTWFAVFMESMKSLSAEAIDAVEGIAGFLEKHEEYYTNTRSAAETAVLFSNRTLYYYLTRHPELTVQPGSGREANLIADLGDSRKLESLQARREASERVLANEYPGCLDALTYAHVPARVLWDEHLTPEKLRGVRTLVLPSAACLSDEQIAAVRRFVEAGGGLIATFETGMYDEWGDEAQRQDWLQFLGVASVEGALVPSRIEDYMTVVSDALPGWRRGLLLPRPLNALKVRPAADAAVAIRYNVPLGKSYMNPQGVSDHPAAIICRRGKGRVIYLASPLFESFNLYRIDAHKDLIRDLARLAAGRSGLQVETNAPGSLAVEVRSQKRRTIVHLVNATGDMKRPICAVVPLRDVEVTLRSAPVRRARALRRNRPLKCTSSRGRASFVLPRVDDYEVVVLEH